MRNIVLYQESRQDLPEITFVKDTVNQIKIRDINNSYELGKRLSLIFTTAYNYSGIKGEISDYDLKDLKNLILNYNNTISLDELAYSFKLERYGILGEKTQHFQLFNADYVSDIIRKYREWKKEIKVSQNISLKPKETEISEEDRKVIREQFLVNIHTDLKNTGYCEDAWILYEDLDIIIGDSKKKEIYKKQYDRYVKELKSDVLNRDLKHKVKRIIAANEEGHHNQEVIRRCKSYIVSDHLNDYISTFEEFKNEIEK